jgi:hypothetical protein
MRPSPGHPNWRFGFGRKQPLRKATGQQKTVRMSYVAFKTSLVRPERCETMRFIKAYVNDFD